MPMAPRTRRPARRREPARREPLSRERVLAAALELADSEGLEALSMRRLGSALGVEAMSLYNHVRNKDEVLDGLVDVVFGEIDLPAGAGWRTAMRRRAVSVREMLRQRPWALGLMESRRRPGPANLRHHDAVLGILRSAGFSVETAGHAYSVLDAYVYGFALNEQSLPLDSPGDVAEVGAAILQQNPMAAYPNLAEFISKNAMRPGYSFGAEFDYGLDLVLDGLERALGRRRTAN